MFANFFIDRPIFAAVLSIFITLVGAIALLNLPIAQYPRIAPPTVQVQTNYPGANAEVVEESVATPIEQQVNGAESMLYMSSLSSNDGQMTLTVTFEIERDQDIASVDVQNREAVAESRLPEEVIRQGVTVRKQFTDFLMVMSIASPENLYDNVFLSNYATLNITDVLARVPGVGSVTVFGARDYGMRIWLRPDRMARLGITATDVTQAIREQNVQAPAGQIGLPPAPRGQEMQYSVTVQGRLAQVSEYENIIVRAQPDGSFVRLRDIARVELGATDYTASAQLNGGAAANIGVYQLPTANALDVAEAVKARLAELAQAFPPGIEYTIPYDTTLFVRASLDEVVKTFFEALALVILVVFIFLQSWRATLIPLLTLLGFSVTLVLCGHGHHHAYSLGGAHDRANPCRRHPQSLAGRIRTNRRGGSLAFQRSADSGSRRRWRISIHVGRSKRRRCQQACANRASVHRRSEQAARAWSPFHFVPDQHTADRGRG